MLVRALVAPADVRPDGSPSRAVRIQLLGRVTALALNVFTFGFLVNGLGAQGFGQMTLGLTVAYVSSVIFGLGLDTSLFRHLSLHPNDASRLGANILAKTASTLVGAVTILTCAAAIPMPGDVRWCVVIAGVSLLASPLTSLHQVLRSRVRLIPLAAADVGSSLLLLASVVALSSTGLLTGPSAMAATLAANGVVWLGLAVVSLKILRPRAPRPALPVVRRVIRAARPISLSEVIVVGYYRADLLVLGALASAAATGVYGAAYRFVDIAMYVQAIVIGAAFPALTRAWSDPERFRSAIRALIRQLVHVGAALGCLIMAAGPEIISRLGGSDFADTRGVLAPLMAGLVVIFANRVLTQALIAGGKRYGQLLPYLGGAGGVALCLILVPPYGAVGAAIGTVIGEAFILAIAAALLSADDVLPLRGLIGTLCIGLPAVGLVTIVSVYAPSYLGSLSFAVLVAAILVWLSGLVVIPRRTLGGVPQ